MDHLTQLRQSSRELVSDATRLICFMLLTACPGALAADAFVSLGPENSRAERYGGGWTCTWGYRRDGDLCLLVKVPANAHLSSTYGDAWTCDRGFRAEAGVCVAIEVPANAYLSDALLGPGWTCVRGYRADNQGCAMIDLPANAYLTDETYGPGWQCARGYRATNAACVRLQIPENAHLDYSGNDWVCERPYLKHTTGCALR